ncbi:hypothetical protein DBV15_01705 [Temnothorax longispinosus]|uniref:Uncharacterized protein n=1 Tax=Temnothorax longispinosus TaxID=300112 RepID=A0A4S2L0P7_9HYME|nr:hypothetical protein DBV15_01705 [Temnothorax longispinosus]
MSGACVTTGNNTFTSASDLGTEQWVHIQIADGNYTYEPAHVSSKSPGITTKRVCPAAAINLTSPKETLFAR